MPGQYTIDPYSVIIPFGLFILLLYPVLEVYNGSNRYKYVETPYYWQTGVLLVLYCVFSYADGDFYHYHELFDKIKFAGALRTNLEPLHYWIIDNLPANYYLWRLVIWGPAVILTLKTIKMLGLDIKVATCFIALIYLSFFSVMRGSLGISIMFLGYSMILLKKNFRSYLWGAVLIGVSFSFHKSMLLPIAILPFCSFVNLTKKDVIISILLFPILVPLIPVIIDYVLNGDMFGIGKDMNIAGALETYSNAKALEFNFWGYVMRVIYYFPIVFSLIYVVKEITFNGMEIPKHIYRFYVFWYIMSYIAFLFYFQEMSNFLFERFLIMAYFPLVVVLSYFYKNHKMTPSMRIIILVAILACFYKYSYVFYKY